MDLSVYRERINDIDDQMVRLFVERMQVAAEIAGAKAEQNLPVLDLKREQAVLQKVMEKAGEDFEIYARKLYQTLFDVSKSYQADILARETELSAAILKNIENPKLEFPKKAVVACQGVEGSFASRACDRMFGMPSKMFFSNYESVFSAVESGLCKYGVLPIGNSSAGSVTEVYDLMAKHHFYIVKSMKLHINHALLARPGVKLEDVQEIISYSQALHQCSDFLKSHPGIKVTIFENTATAAQYVAQSDRKDIAALSSTDCAKLYGLHVLKDSMQNNENNYTRFICVTKDMELFAGSDKISLMLSLDHRPGALHELIGKFACRGINLCKLESRPIPGKDFEFRFYFDLDGSVFSSEMITVLKDIEQAAESLTFLGCYSEV